jgi:hypothetical protein
MTPEGKVKQKVKGILAQYGVYYYMPVQTGYGLTSLDFIGCYNGLFFAIETKAEGKRMTDRQLVVAKQMFEAGAQVFLVAGLDDRELAPLILWLEINRPTSHDHSHQSRPPSHRPPLPG